MRPLGFSRLRDQKGHRIDWRGLLYLPHAFLSASLLRTVGYRERKPWLGYRAIKRLDRLIAPEWKILEFGSGMSTAWFAERCREVVSIESDPDWFQMVERILQANHMSNVNLQLKERGVFHNVDVFPDAYFDFALIDGIDRDACMQTALRKVRRHGHVYLDNSDQYADNPAGHTRVAENMLRSYLKRVGGKAYYFVDFSPGNFYVSEGLLAQL